MDHSAFFDFINNPTLAITNGNSATAGLRSLKKYPSNYQYLQILYEGLPDAQKLYNAKHRIIINPISACGNPAKFDTYSTGYLDLCSNKDCKTCEEIRINAIVQSQIKYNQFKAITISDAELKENSEYLKSFISNYTLRQINSALNNDDTSCNILELYSELGGDKCSFEKLYLAINELRGPPKAQCSTHYAEFVTYEKGYSNKCSMGFRCQDYKNIKLKEQSSYRKEHAYEIGPQGSKAQSTMQEKYGTSDMNDKIFRDKAKITNIEKYGTSHPMQSSIIKEKTKNTIFERYGVSSLMQVPEFLKRNQETNKSNHGGIHALSTPELKEQIRLSNLRNNGVEYPMQNKEIHAKALKTNLERYGAEFYFQRNDVKRGKIKQNTERKYNNFKKANFTPNFNISEYTSFNGIYSFTCNKCDTTFDARMTHHIQIPRCEKCNPRSISTIHMELYDYIKELYSGVIINNDRSTISPSEMDIYIPELKIAFEMNGLYWHNVDTNKHITPEYHQQKYLKCKDNGITLYTIFEDDWLYNKDVVKNRIKSFFGLNTDKIYARKCIIKDISEQELNDFCTKTHTQGHARGSKYRYGLFYKDELHAVMSFSSITGGYELKRYCSKSTIVGGCSKLLEHFKRVVNPEYILSYADLEFGNGDVYSKIGFTFDGYTVPSYTYDINGIRVNRMNYQKHMLKDKLDSFDPKLTEEENMLINGYYRVYSCGNARYIWKKN